MDNANIPNLISTPYLGYFNALDASYLATRKTLLSSENPYYYSGKYLSGIGSSHTSKNYVWPIALSMQGMTTPDKAEKKWILDSLAATDGRDACHARGGVT